jgi:hypothetical protein
MGRPTLRGKLIRRKQTDVGTDEWAGGGGHGGGPGGDEPPGRSSQVLIRCEAWPPPEAGDRWDVLGLDRADDDQDWPDGGWAATEAGASAEAPGGVNWSDEPWADTLAWADADDDLDLSFDASSDIDDLDAGGDLATDDLTIDRTAIDRTAIDRTAIDSTAIDRSSDDDLLLLVDGAPRSDDPTDLEGPLDLGDLFPAGDANGLAQVDPFGASDPAEEDDPWLAQPWSLTAHSAADAPVTSGSSSGSEPARGVWADGGVDLGEPAAAVAPDAQSGAPSASRFAQPGVHDDLLPLRPSRTRLRR